ncbi:hypothetical protein [Bradyrhizobium cenepequi]
MLRPHGPYFFGGGEIATCDLGISFRQIGFFLGGQLKGRLIDARELQHDARELVLLCIRQIGNGTERFFE